ncbi:hypothetical protein [Halopiger xanaduensis]|uniref:Uncharacterized protein n=1 Tax=Halopiger xanaduensis (strain DSM 18323 / JCM 14033 / SH-6) TaxID=797210 RepID=F8DBI1_HALXS|nr:hypothetical protein [Halopiger xanaduensis]AEH37099.1 hypothetical protein Halxa_2481 [Halopiger xanaduensis SH-6]
MGTNTESADDENPLHDLVEFVDADELEAVRAQLSAFRAEMNGQLDEAERFRNSNGELDREQFLEGDDGAA